jgi:hypothetical protein
MFKVATNMIPIMNNLNKDLNYNAKLKDRGFITEAKWMKLMQAKEAVEGVIGQTIQFANLVDPG